MKSVEEQRSERLATPSAVKVVGEPTIFGVFRTRTCMCELPNDISEKITHKRKYRARPTRNRRRATTRNTHERTAHNAHTDGPIHAEATPESNPQRTSLNKDTQNAIMFTFPVSLHLRPAKVRPHKGQRQTPQETARMAQKRRRSDIQRDIVVRTTPCYSMLTPPVPSDIVDKINAQTKFAKLNALTWCRRGRKKKIVNSVGIQNTTSPA